MSYDKPFKSYQDQVSYIEQQHKLRIEDRQLAERFLRVFSYYDLVNGYKDLFMQGDIFNKNISFNYLILFNEFNIQFQNILFKYSVIVENIFKSNFAYILSKNFGEDVNDYLDFKCYINPMTSAVRADLTKTINSVKHLAINTRKLPTRHYRYNHNHIPPWILFKNVSFGTIVDLSTFLKAIDKQELFDLLLSNMNHTATQKAQVIEAVTLVRKFRNSIAHNMKFITYRAIKSIDVDNMPNLLVAHLLYDKAGQHINDIYAMIVSLVYLLNEAFLIEDLVDDFQGLFERFKEKKQQNIIVDYLNLAGVPSDLLARLDKLYNALKIGNNSHD